MNTMKFMFMARNNLLPFNFKTLYSIKLHKNIYYIDLKLELI